VRLAWPTGVGGISHHSVCRLWLHSSVLVNDGRRSKVRQMLAIITKSMAKSSQRNE
jgi:hypothetical protein